MNSSTADLPSITNSWSLPKLMSIESVMPSNHLSLCHPHLLLPSILQDPTVLQRPPYTTMSSSRLLSGKVKVQSCPTLCDLMNRSTPGLPVCHQLLEFPQTHVHQVVMPSNHLTPCCPLLLLPSIFPSIRVFSNESVLCLRWPKYWSFNFSISPSNEYSGLIYFRMDWWDLLAVQGNYLFFIIVKHNSQKIERDNNLICLKLNDV